MHMVFILHYKKYGRKKKIAVSSPIYLTEALRCSTNINPGKSYLINLCCLLLLSQFVGIFLSKIESRETNF